MSWRNDLALVAGADLSSQQYKFIGPTGILATSQTNAIGVIQNKPQNLEHIAYAKQGRTKLYMAQSVGDGAWVGQSNTTSGVGAIITPPGYVWGITNKGCNSGGLARVDLFGSPIYIHDDPFVLESGLTFTSAHSSTAEGQYKFVNYGGTLASSALNVILGVLQANVNSGSTGRAVRKGRTYLTMAASVGIGAWVGQSNASSGFGAIVTSGGFACGVTVTACDSGLTAYVDLLSGPSYIAK